METAIKLIEDYVNRGDRYEWLSSSYMGHSNPGGMGAMIGGHINGKAVGCHNIAVYRDLSGHEVNQVVSLKEVYNFIKKGQQRLF